MTFKKSNDVVIYKIENKTSFVKKINTNLTEINKNKKAPYLPMFVKTLQPTQTGGNYVKTFENI
jgi:hypothetical protein